MIESNKVHLEPAEDVDDIIPFVSIVILEPSTLIPPKAPIIPLPAIGKLDEGIIPIKLLKARSCPFILYLLPNGIFILL